MKHSEALKLVAVLSKSFPNAKFDEDNATAYISAILDLDAGAAGRAIERLRATKTFLPSIAEIREATLSLKVGPQRTGLEAYQIALSAVRQHGYISPPQFRDWRLDRAIAMCGGWVEFCSAPADASERARFVELYDTLATRERQDAVSDIQLPEPSGSVKKLT